MNTSTLTLTPPNESIINLSASRRSGRSRAAAGPSITRRATLLVLVGLLPSCLARLSAGASMSSADIVAAASPAIVVGNAPIDGILTTTDRELGSKSSKSKSSKSKSSKSKSSKTKSSKTKSSKKKKKKSSVFNKAGDSSSKSKKNKKLSSKSSSKSKKSSSSSDKKKKPSSDEKRKDSSKSDSDKKNKKSESLELTDVTKEVVSILKDRKNVVNGKDKTKDLDQKDLRNKVLDELDIKDSDRGEAKKMFEDAIEKLEKKDEIKVASDGDVKIFVSMDESDSDSDSDDTKKKKSESLELTDVTKEVVSILKDRKKVVDGEDKTKTLDQKKLRDKVLDELDVKDSDRGEAKDLFEEALKKLEKKDEIKVNGDGDVKIHVSMDDSKDSSSSDEKDFRSSNAKTTGGIFGQATVEDEVPTDYTNTTGVNGHGLDTSVLPTDPDATVPLDNGDSIIIIDQAETNEADEAENGAVGGSTSANETEDDASPPNKNEADVPTDDGESANENDTSDADADSLANGVEDATENVNGDSSTVDLSGKSDGSCGTGCKVGVSFAGVGLLVGVASVAAKMAMANKDGEEEDFESDEEEEEEEAENDPSFTPAAEEEV